MQWIIVAALPTDALQGNTKEVFAIFTVVTESMPYVSTTSHDGDNTVFHLSFLDTEGVVEANQKMVDKIMRECKLELFDKFLYCIIWSDSFWQQVDYQCVNLCKV